MSDVWTGTRVLRRRDADGTQWTIQLDKTAKRIDQLYVLEMTHRDIRLRSTHASTFAAKAHADDLLTSWRARSLRDYPDATPAVAIPAGEELPL